MPDAQLEIGIVDLVGRISSATYDLLVLVGELDARGTYLLRGALSCAAWLADRCDLELVTAHNQVRVAKAMRTYPELAEAMATGDVSYCKARMLVPHLTPEHAAELVALAAVTPASGLAMAIACWSYGHESQDEIDARHQAERSVSWRCDPDGMIRITALLAPAEAAGVCAMIDKVVTTTTPNSGTTPKTGSAPTTGSTTGSTTEADAAPETPTGVTDGAGDGGTGWPSLAQQRADALVAIVTQPGTGTVDTEVVIHVTEAGNALADGTPLTDNAVTRVLPEAFVSLLMVDSQRRPIDASPRRRGPTRRQQRVIDARDDECQYPGCHATVFLEYDHKQPYPLAGPTTIDNLQRLCGRHNRAKYQAEIAD